MDIENFVIDNGFYYYPVDNFATIKIAFRFLIPNDRFSVVKARLLCRYLRKTNSKYSSYKMINYELKKLYNMSLEFSIDKVGSARFFSLNVRLLNPKLIGEDYLTEAFNFIKDMLMSPNFKGDNLDSVVFSQVKKDTINDAGISLSKPKIKSNRLSLFNSLPECNLTNNLVLDLDEYEKIVNDIQDKDIIDFYNNIVLNNFFRGYVFGNITSDEFKIFRNLFPFVSKCDELDYSEVVQVKSGYAEDDDINIEDSSLYVVYQLNNYSLSKWYLYKIISLMLSSTNGLCHKVLRDENGLVYSAGAYINKYRFWGFMVISADINVNKKMECLNGIDEIFMRLQDESIVTDLLNFAKEKISQEYLLIY